jgi:hypothetical protein
MRYFFPGVGREDEDEEEREDIARGRYDGVLVK